MIKTKKVLSAVLACITLFGTSVTAFAANESVDTNENIEIVNLSQNIDASEIEEIKDSVGAKMVFDDGTEIPVNTVVTIEDNQSSSKSRGYSSNSNSYKITVTASVDTTQDVSAGNNSRKIVSDTQDRNNSKVVASISLQMIWTDVKGGDNTLDKLSGSRTITKGVVSKGTLTYRDLISATTSKDIDVTKFTSFTYYPNKTFYAPMAIYTLQFKNVVAALDVWVSSSLFQ